MSKAVLISIQPKWCEKIANGNKTVEVRKTRLRLEAPFKCYIYETKGSTNTPWVDEDGHMIFNGRGMVIGEFICDRIDKIVPAYDQYGIYDVDDDYVEQACLAHGELWHYGNGRTLYGWHISSLMIYCTPRPITDFQGPCAKGLYCESCAMHSENLERCGNAALWLKHAPQSWCYVEEL